MMVRPQTKSCTMPGQAGNRNYVNGYRRRPCLCGRSMCVEIWKHWANHDDPKRSGHIRVPAFQVRKTDLAETTSSFCHSIYAKLFSSGTRAPREETIRYVAYHHFPLSLL